MLVHHRPPLIITPGHRCRICWETGIEIVWWIFKHSLSCIFIITVAFPFISMYSKNIGYLWQVNPSVTNKFWVFSHSASGVRWCASANIRVPNLGLFSLTDPCLCWWHWSFDPWFPLIRWKNTGVTCQLNFPHVYIMGISSKLAHFQTWHASGGCGTPLRVWINIFRGQDFQFIYSHRGYSTFCS